MESTEDKFAARPVGAKKKTVKKAAPRRVIASRIKKTTTASNAPSGVKYQKMERELKSIYEDGNGKMPNMRSIKKHSGHPLLKGILVLLLLGGAMAAAAWLGFFYLPNQKQAGADSMVFEINGPTEFAIGATTTYTIRWTNKQKVTAEKITLTVNYPEDFVFMQSTLQSANAGNSEWKIDETEAGAGGEIKITGKNYSTLNTPLSWRAFMTYKLENFESELQKNATLAVQATESPVSVSLTGPDRLAAGDNAEYTFSVKNETDWIPEKIYLKPIFPANFHITSSSPTLSKNNYWIVVLSATSTEETKYIIQGKFSDNGSGEEMQKNEVAVMADFPFDGDNKLVTLAESKITSEVAKSAQAFSLAINGTMQDFGSRPGETLNMTLYFKNGGKESMKNVSVKLTIDAPSLKRQSAMDWANIYDPLDGNIIGTQIDDVVRRGEITWTKEHFSKLAEIKPGEEGVIDLRLPLHNTENFDLASIDAHLITITDELTYKNANGEEKTINGNSIIITLNSDLEVEVRQSGDQTKKISWILTNDFHPLKNLELTASFYGDVSCAIDAEAIPAGEAGCDNEDGKIFWRIPEMPEGVDVLALPFTLTINKEDPTQNTVLSKVRVKAEDAVTGQTIEFMGDEVKI